jgi:hypothetical protein
MDRLLHQKWKLTRPGSPFAAREPGYFKVTRWITSESRNRFDDFVGHPQARIL